MSKDLGKSTSYAYYVEAGGTKTPQEYGEMLVNIDTVATRAEDAADSAAESATGALNSKNAAQTAATTANNKASEATTAAQTATTKAGEASTSASQASASAQTASNKASEASQSASTASAKATEATTAATSANTAKTDAVAAKTAAETAQAAAETAQTAAEDAAASVQSSAAQIATNTADISDLKENLSDVSFASKNVLPNTTETTSLVSCDMEYSDGVLTVSGTASGSGGRRTKIINDFPLESGFYTLSKDKVYTDPAVSNNIAIILQTYNGTVIGILDVNATSVTFEITDGSINYFIGLNFIQNNYYNAEYKIQLEKGTQATEWNSPSYVTAVDKKARLGIADAFNVFNSNFNVLSAFQNIYCIGDSLTYGQVYTSASASRRSITTYPQALGKMLGVTVSQNAIGGFSAKDWWDTFKDDIVAKDGQLVIVYLGTNGGLTDSMNTDVVGDDYTQWADTNTGDYAKIIAKSQSVGANVLLIMPYASSGDLSTTKTVIKKMADKFGCGLLKAIELQNVYHLWPDGTGANAVHLNDLGYCALASAIINEVALMDSEYLAYLIPQITT